MSLPRPLARPASAAVAALVALIASVTLAAGASAHVSVSSQDAEPGGFGKLTFRVPNESDTARTVSLRIQIPEESAMASLRAQPVPGWTVIMTTAELAEPLEAHGQELTRYVSVVEFRAEDGGGIGPGEFQEFALSGGPFPVADVLTFPAVQRYSDGNESAWIEPAVAGQDEPERPAPVLSLAEATGATAVTEAADEHGNGVTDPGAPALFLAILALLVAIAGVVLGLRANRRTVSS